MPEQALCIAIVGHTNAGKTSLLRTLTRQVDFGEVSARPGTTRHAETADLRLDGALAVRFIDTPGLEDAVDLLDYLRSLPAATPLQQVQQFLQGPEAHGAYEQEAKVLRALTGQADAAMYVIDTREPVLPKYRAEIEILRDCAKPVLPVLNFMREPASRGADWHQALLESGLHARVAFDVVAPFLGAEQQLYGDLGTLLPARRAHIQRITEVLREQARQRDQAACRVVASALIDVAAMRRTQPAHLREDAAAQQAFVRSFEDEVRQHARRAVQALLQVFAFRPGDAELTDIPALGGRWDDDLFNPALLKSAGKRLGLGAAVGAGLGAVADLALAGLSLGAATTLGATLGGVASGGWRPVWRKLENRVNGVQELSAEDPLLLLLAERLLTLARALSQRGHAAQDKLQLPAQASGQAGFGPAAGDTAHALSAADASLAAYEQLRPLLAQLSPARSRPDWERHRPDTRAATSTSRHQLEITLARHLESLLPQPSSF